MLPNFVVIGAAKCGTTSLCQALGAHPRVFMSTPKEIHYFGRKDPEKTRSWYEAHFADAGTFEAVGEGSTSYTHPDIIESCASEIAQAIPDARLIYMVRNPLRRLESDWKMRKHEGWAPEGSINAAARQPNTSLVSHGLYWRNLSIYRQHFPDDQILIVFLEEFAADQGRELGRCLKHVGVDPSEKPTERAPGTVEANRSGDFRRDGFGAGMLRRLGVVDAVRSVVPRPVFEFAKSRLTRADRFEIEWKQEARDEVLDVLRVDAERFLEHCGRPSTFWTY